MGFSSAAGQFVIGQSPIGGTQTSGRASPNETAPTTLLLDRSTWDLVLDVSGNIAVAGNPYSLAQDAASAIKLFQGELWYDTSKGVPYWTQILGKSPNFALIKAKFVAAALTVPGIVAARCFISNGAPAIGQFAIGESFISGPSDRTINGQVQVTNRAGVISAAAF